MRTLIGLAAAPVLLGVLAACGSETGAGDDAAGAASESPAASSSPTAEPTVGTYPGYPHDDYTYVLTTRCFCPDANRPIRITVRDGEFAEAYYVKANGENGKAATQEWVAMTLDDVIAAANNTEADVVEVTWPAGQEYPSQVSVDQMEMAMDDELTYVVSEVEPVG